MTRYNARWILPVSSAPIEHGSLAEENGRITFVGSQADAPPSHDQVDLGEAILLPGLVNAHCHLELTAMRGFLDGLAFRDWILRLTFARRAVLTPEMLLDSALLGVDEGIARGITTFADTGDTGAGFDAMLERGVRGICYREVFGPDPRQSEEALAGLVDRVLDMQRRETALVRVGVSPHAPYTVSDALYRATAAFARERNLPIAVHIAESQLESDLVAGATGDFADGLRHRGIEIVPRAASPLSLMQALGVLGTETLLIHCVRVDAEDIRLIADSDSAVAHCPVSNARLGHGIAPLRALLNANLRVGLGTDSVASSDRMDILDEARVAGLFANVREAHHAAIPTSTLLELATVGGARALGIDREVGTLEPGKWADLAAFRLDSLKAPVFDPFAAVIHALAGMRASDVVVAGRPLLRNSQLIHRDADLPNRVQATAQKLQEWLKTSLVPSPTPP